MEVRHEPPGNRKEDVGSDELGRRVNDLRMIQTQGPAQTLQPDSGLRRRGAFAPMRERAQHSQLCYMRVAAESQGCDVGVRLVLDGVVV